MRWIARLVILAAIATLGAACSSVGTHDEDSPSPGTRDDSYQGIPFSHDSVVFTEARLAALTDAVLCVDPGSEARTCFRINSESKVEPGLQVGDEVGLVTVNGIVSRVGTNPS